MEQNYGQRRKSGMSITDMRNKGLRDQKTPKYSFESVGNYNKVQFLKKIMFDVFISLSIYTMFETQ